MKRIAASRLSKGHNMLGKRYEYLDDRHQAVRAGLVQAGLLRGLLLGCQIPADRQHAVHAQ